VCLIATVGVAVSCGVTNPLRYCSEVEPRHRHDGMLEIISSEDTFY
jgi:predicted protein tyrosine phosphatase